MAIAINSSFTASVPAAYGGSTPVIDLGQSPAAISTAVALANAGSVVVNVSGAPPGSVTYTATGLLHEIALSGTATVKPATPSQEEKAVGEGILAAVDGSAVNNGADGVYDGSGVFKSMSGIPAAFADVLKSDPGLSDVAVSDSIAQGIVGTLVATQA